MNVGIITSTFTPNLNGISVSLQKLVEQLQQRKVNTWIATPKIHKYKYLPYVFPMRVIPFTHLFQRVLQDIQVPFLYRVEMEKFFKTKNIDVIHSHDTGILFKEAGRLAQLFKVPHVHTYHTLMEEYLKILHPFGYRWYARILTRRACNHADIVIAPTDKIKKYLHKIGVKTEVIALLNVPNIDHLSKISKDSDLMKKLGISKDDFVFISFGRVVKQKSIDTSIDYLTPLLKKHKSIKFLIMGFGPEIDNLKKHAREKGVGDKVIFSGEYSRYELVNYANLADCFVITSKSETQGVTLLEAMACGLPVVAIDDTAYDYILKDQYNGLKGNDYNFTEILETIYLNRDLRLRMSDNALFSAQELSKRNFTLEYIDLYNRAIEKYKQKFTVNIK